VGFWVSGAQAPQGGVIRFRVEAWGVGFRQAELRPQQQKIPNDKLKEVRK